MAASASTLATRLLSMQQVSCEACTAILAKRVQRKAHHIVARHAHSRTGDVSLSRSPHSLRTPASSAIASSSNSRAAATRQTRHFHSSRRTGFTLFGYKKKTNDIESIAQSFQEALEEEDAERITQAYTSLRQALLADASLQASDYISVEDVSKAMNLLSQTSYINEDFRSVRRMSQDLRTLWRQDALSAEAYSSYITALVNSGRFEEAQRTLFEASVPSRDSPIDGQIATSQDWNTYLQAFSDSCGKAYSATKKAFERIPQTHRDARTYTILLETVLAEAHLKSDQADLRGEIQDLLRHINKLTSSSEHQSERHTALLMCHHHGIVPPEEAANAYKELDALVIEKHSSPEAIIALIRYEVSQARLSNTDYGNVRRRSTSLVGAFPAARRDLTATILKDITQTRSTFSLQELREALSQVETITGILPDYTAYEHAMHCSQSLEDALALLRDSHRDGISLSSGMLRAIVYKLPKEGVDANTQETIKSIYGDLGRSRLSDSRSRDGIHDASLYIALLQYCARKDVSDLNWATTLMEDLKAHGLSILNSEEATLSKDHIRQDQPHSLLASTSAASIVTSLMENASRDHSQAFKAYAWMWAVDPDNIFSKQDWYNIIRTYADLDVTQISGSTKKSYVPSSIFFAFFEDMRKSGFPPDSPIYQAVLRYYAREGGSAKSSVEAVRLIHGLIKMDHYYDPDIELMNGLMHAYSQTGSLDSAVGVWRSILINKIPFNNDTVSIILDVYGNLGDFGKAAKLWESLKIKQVNEQIFEIDKKNLESFIEVACRTGNSVKAIEEYFAALQWKEGALGDEEILRTLLRYTEADPRAFQTIRKRIQKELPQYWPLVERVALPDLTLEEASEHQPKSSFSFSSLANRQREASESANESGTSDVQLQKP